MNPKVREALCDMGHEDAIVFDAPDFDDAIIGVTDDGQVVYDYDAMVLSLMKQDNISMEEAVEFIEFNTIRACAYQPNPPIIMYRIPQE